MRDTHNDKHGDKIYGEVPAVARITGSHHVLGVEHLLDQLGDGECTVLLGSTARQWGKPWQNLQVEVHMDR